MLISGAHAVEQEWVNVIVQRLVVKEELRQQTQVSAPSPLPPTVNLKEADIVVAVDLVARWVKERTFVPMPFELLDFAEITEAEFTDVYHITVAELLRIR